MGSIPLPTASGSPEKVAEFHRNGTRLVSTSTMSPRSAQSLYRRNQTPLKYRAAQQQSRKASNPLGNAQLKARLESSGKQVVTDDDEWQDIDVAGDPTKPVQPSMGQFPDLKPTSLSTSQAVVHADMSELHLKPLSSSRANHQLIPNMSGDHPSDKTNEQLDNDGGASSTSFLGFSPSQAGAKFLQKINNRGQRFRLSWNSPWNGGNDSSEGQITPAHEHQAYMDALVNRGSPSRTSPSRGSPIHREYMMQYDQPYQTTPQPQPQQQQQYQQPTSQQEGSSIKQMLLNPSMPGLIALYLQVIFNIVMVGSLLYAIFIFYLTIRNDVNLKVEEYAVDIGEQISKCTMDYVRNGCEPSKRVPAMEAACSQWERCMKRDPTEVGRAKVSAETFGTIIEAFLKPIGIKSMIFLIGVFAGSFLLVNGVFSSKIGPRFSYTASPSTPLPPQQYQPAHAAPQSVQQQHIPLGYQPQPAYASAMISPSHIATPRGRHSPLRASLQSSPVRPSYMGYPY